MGETSKRDHVLIHDLRARVRQLEVLCEQYIVTSEKFADENNRLRRAAEAYRDLATCYRTVRHPSEALLRRMDRARADMGVDG